VVRLRLWHYLAMRNSVVVYCVRLEFADEATRERYVEWLREGHCLAMVREGGAMSGEVTVLEDGSVESRYLFGSQADFDAYESGAAPRLRAETGTRFPPEAGVRIIRTLGVRAVRVPD